MTDKEQIIIDGVDVSGCVYRDSENRCCCDSSKKNEGEERLTGRGGCAYNPNCYFKQLARYRKALEEIKKTILLFDAGIKPKLYDFETDTKILDIINKAKELR